MIVKWPGKVKAGTITDHQSGFLDLLPTFCDIAGTDIPSGIDGISFLPTLLTSSEAGSENITQQEKHDYLYWEFYEQGGKQAVRKDQWKYVKLNVRDSSKDIVIELYDLSKDISEENNIVSEHPETVEEMEAILKASHTPTSVISLFSMKTNAETAF
jgi:arylsulfatase A-like enzyme